MDDRSSTSKPAISSPSPSITTSDIKSPTTRPLYSSKLGDQRGRAPEAATSNPTARQPPVQQKAWTSAKNPITGRSQTPQGNSNLQSKQSVTGNLREGQRVRIVLATGAEFEGTCASSPDTATFRLNMVQQKKLPNSAEIANGAGRREQAMMSFQRKEIIDARVISSNQAKNDGKATNGNRSSFRTDAAISNPRPGAERALKPWVPDTVDDGEGGLEKSANSGTWDQFAANEHLFGLKTDYDENIYTTTIDMSHPKYKERAAAAERKAREIERSTAATAHVAEERVMDFAGGDDRDEEEKYSGVRRQDFPPLSNRENKYTTPARRAPTGAATVKGAPVDPAIISSQLKSVPVQKQPAARADEVKSLGAANKPPTTVALDAKSTNFKPESKVDAKTTEKQAPENKAETKVSDIKSNDNNGTLTRPSAATSRTISPQSQTQAKTNATETVERDLLNSFKSFANSQRQITEKVRLTKAKADKEVKLTELKKFSSSFKLSTPVPKDLISIIAKDPVKQKEIQEKALRNAEEIALQKAAAEAAQKEKETAVTKEPHAKPATEPSSTTAAPAAVDTRSTSRPTAPQHANSPSGNPNRHPGARSYNAQSHYPSYGRGNNRGTPHLGNQTQTTGQLAQRLRNMEQHRIQHPHMGQHPQGQDMRLPPTGPANSAEPSSFGRRISGVQQSYMGGPKLNPNSHEFRPNAFAQPFNPGAPSQASSPRSSVNTIVVETVLPTPVRGQLIRRKTKAVDVKKCFILSHIKSIQPPPERHWDDTDGLRPSFDTTPTWRQLQEEMERPDSTMNLTYEEYFERLPLSSAAIATPNPSHAMPQIAHQHQLPLHLQHGTQNMAPRQSPHMPPMQMHSGQHGHGPHMPFSSPDDHRMMHSNSAQSFASPRMGQVPMAYPPAMNAPTQIPYNQPVMQPYMNPGAPQMGFRSFSNNPQFMPQQAHHMPQQMMVQPQQFITPNGMVTTAPQVQMYPGFLPPGAGPPPQMGGSNGFPSPSRPAAPMMAHQGSQQGQAVYGMSPGMQYQQPVYGQQHPQGKFSGQRPQ